MAQSRRAASQPAQSMAWAVITASIGAAGYAGYRGLPPVPFLWGGLVVAAWIEPPATLTGRKDARGYPTPADAGEERCLEAWRFWKDARIRLIVPSGSWLPGWPIYASFIAGVLAAALAFFIPVATFRTWPAIHSQLLDELAAFIVVSQLPAIRRSTIDQDCPGTRHDSLLELLAPSKVVFTVLLLVSGGVIGAVGGVVAVTQATTHHVAIPYHPWFVATLSILAAGLAITPMWMSAALTTWRAVFAAKKAWRPRWEALKIDPSPVMRAHNVVGPAVVDTFDASAGLGSAGFLGQATKILPTLGPGVGVCVLETPNLAATGPIPGTKHPTRFDVVTWPAAELPDPADPELDQAVFELFARSAMVWTLEPLGFARPVLLSATRISAEGKPSAWATTWAWPDGPSLTEIRPLRDNLQTVFKTEVLIDHRGDVVYIGSLGGDDEDYVEDGATYPQTFERLRIEDEWNARWASVLKSDANPPVIQHDAYAETPVSGVGMRGEVTVRCQPFVARVGIDPASYRGLEPALATTLRAAPFVAVTGWPGPQGGRPGDRHPQALAVVWADAPVPSGPEDLVPPRAASLNGPRFVLAGRLNAAFDSVKLARPEIVSIRPLTARNARRHLWEIELRLYGGITSGQVRKAGDSIRQALGSGWLRVADRPDGCAITVGAGVGRDQLAKPDADWLHLVELDWSEAFLAARLTGSNGEVPQLESVTPMPKNPDVESMIWVLPPGLDRARIRGNASKLRSATDHEFVEVRDVPGSASKVEILKARTMPLPTLAEFDFDAVDQSHAVPFATGIDGEPVVYDPLESPHALLAGQTGSGKAQPLDTWIPVPVSDAAPTGTTTIREVNVGDWVFAADGSPCQVVGLSPIREERLYRVHFDDGQVVECSANHLWRVVGGINPESSFGVDLDEEHIDVERLRRIAAGENDLYATLDEVAAEVGIHQVTLSEMGIERLGVVVTGAGAPLAPHYPLVEVARTVLDAVERGGWRVVATTEDIESALSTSAVRLAVATPDPIQCPAIDAISPPAFGLTMAALESAGDDIPVPMRCIQVLRGSIAQRRGSLAAWLERSTHVSRGPTGVVLDVSSEGVARFATSLIRSLGAKARLTPPRPDHPSWTVRFWMPDDTRSFDPMLRALVVTKVERTDEHVPMRCLFVDHPDHLYLTEDFVPTHNSVMAQAFLYGSLVRGHDVYIVDPSKGGADFHFAKPYARAVGQTLDESVAIMQGVYNEVLRRKDANTRFGVGSGADLPEEHRYPRIVLLIDEFTSLISTGKVPAKSDDPEAQLEREAAMAENAARARIGGLAGRIAREARSALVTILLATQKLTVAMLDPIPGAADLKTNLARSFLGKGAFSELQSALRSPDQAPDVGDVVPKGRGIWEPSSQPPAVVQCWFAPQDRLAAELRSRRAPLTDAERFDPASVRAAQPAPPLPAAAADVLEGDVIDLGEIDLSDWNLPDESPGDDLWPDESESASQPIEATDDDDNDDIWGAGGTDPPPIVVPPAPAPDGHSADGDDIWP